MKLHPLPFPLSTADIMQTLKKGVKEIRAVDPIKSFIHIMENPTKVSFLKRMKIYFISKMSDRKIININKKYEILNSKGIRKPLDAINAPKEYWKEVFAIYRKRNKAVHKVDRNIKFRTLPLEGDRIFSKEVKA